MCKMSFQNMSNISKFMYKTAMSGGYRNYCAFLGSSALLCTYSAIVETPHLHTITGMVDYGTLMLLFSMMILMRMLAVTGFFSWFAVKMVQLARQDPKNLFFLLTCACGYKTGQTIK